MTLIVVIRCKHKQSEQVQTFEQIVSWLKQHGESTIEITVNE